MATRNLDLDVLMKGAEPAEGPFFDTVVSNVKRGRFYRFLLPADPDDGVHWAPMVECFQELLVKRTGGRQGSLVSCQFRQTLKFPVTGFSIHDLDVTQLRTEQPGQYERLVASDSIEGSHIGYLAPPIPHAAIGLLMQAEHLRHGRKSFDEIWKDAKQVERRARPKSDEAA